MGGYTASRCPYPLPPLTPPIYPILPLGPQALPVLVLLSFHFCSILYPGGYYRVSCGTRTHGGFRLVSVVIRYRG